MPLIKERIRLGFRYLFLVLALIIVVYVFQKNLVLSRELVYQVDFSQAITQNIEGPYPSQRTIYNPNQDSLQILAEPLYLKIYSPIEFNNLKVIGQIESAEKNLQIGLKQSDSSWTWQTIEPGNFAVDFSLAQAKLVAKKLELIFAFPDLAAGDQIQLNNLQLILQR